MAVVRDVTQAGERLSFEKYREYWNQFYALLAPKSPLSPNQSLIEESYELQKFVLNAIGQAATATEKNPTTITIGQLKQIAPSIELDRLMEVLNKHFNRKSSFSGDDVVVLTDAAVLAAIERVSEAFDRDKVLGHLAWLFVQSYAAIADPRLILATTYGSAVYATSWDPTTERRRFCAAEVEASYQVLVSAMLAVSRFPVTERDAIENSLHGLVHAAADLVSKTPWIDSVSREIARVKFESLETVLWPAANLLTSQGLSRAYGSFPDTAASFAHLWVETRRAAQHLAGTKTGDKLFQMPSSYSPPYLHYEHGLNSLFVSMGALHKPLFRSKGTKAMFFGGLGYLFAKELVKVIDRTGIRVNASGINVGSWLSAETQKIYEEKVKCGQPFPDDVFPEVPAMEVAHSAWLASRGPRDKQLSNRWTEAQLFFISACSAMCAHSAHDEIYAGGCNKAVRNFAPFAHAFNCSRQAVLNPSNKCLFFGA